MNKKTDIIMSIFEFCEIHADSGLGLALLDADNTVITPYLDPSDHPEIMVFANGRSVCGHWWICPHDGILETNRYFFA